MKRPKKPKPMSEHAHQRIVANWLDFYGLTYTATANGAHLAGRGFAQWNKLKSSGVRAGVPDLLIFDPPPSRPGCPGVAIELKRADGGEGPTKEQLEWIERLTNLGWVAEVANGHEEAIAILKACGYGPKRAA